MWKMRRRFLMYIRCIFGVFKVCFVYCGVFLVFWGGILVPFWCIFGVLGGILVSFWCFYVFFACVVFLDEKSAKKCRF